MQKKKKKSTAILLLLAMVTAGVLAFTACDPDEPEPADNIIPKGIDEKRIQYIEALDSFYDSIKQQGNIIKSIEHLVEYTKLFPTEIFSDKYDSSFFENFNLLIVPKKEPNYGIRHKVEKIVLQDDTQLYVRINRINPPGESPQVITFWFILIPVKKEYFNGDEVIIEYRNTYPKR